eukprot:TRINITY_DN43470_c0_g1_i1.p1 TRINITY_DN43470_c0_g1~~TRINITY_DN43470_c0_g1_i1.p1  ORF type:complete len:215 (-),score=35.87 TRINITY_DN43470_c0_g1_i1:223-867(-)
MGMIFGIVREEMPPYKLIHSGATYEVRKYAPSVVAECSYGGEWGGGDDGTPFRALANYIGVFGSPQNIEAEGRAAEAIAMTAPVLVSPATPNPESIAMTAPVLVSAPKTSEHTMAFVLPASKYSTVEEAPQPTDPRIRLRQLPERVQAVRSFSWSFRPDSAKTNLVELVADLEHDGWTMLRDDDGEVVWQAAGYNPPFAIPFLKRNEVLVNVME